jgi:3-oxoacyl-[acyl-carrier-protein] synthase II
MLLQLGKADIIVCGGSEAAVTASGMGGFNSLMALSTRNDDYKTASRPFDKDRDGFVLGEGAGCIILKNMNTLKNVVLPFMQNFLVVVLVQMLII